MCTFLQSYLQNKKQYKKDTAGKVSCLKPKYMCSWRPIHYYARNKIMFGAILLT